MGETITKPVYQSGYSIFCQGESTHSQRLMTRFSINSKLIQNKAAMNSSGWQLEGYCHAIALIGNNIA